MTSIPRPAESWHAWTGQPRPDLSGALVSGADFTGARVFGAVMPDGSRTYSTINHERRLRWGPTK